MAISLGSQTTSDIAAYVGGRRMAQMPDGSLYALGVWTSTYDFTKVYLSTDGALSWLDDTTTTRRFWPTVDSTVRPWRSCIAADADGWAYVFSTNDKTIRVQWGDWGYWEADSTSVVLTSTASDNFHLLDAIAYDLGNGTTRVAALIWREYVGASPAYDQIILATGIVNRSTMALSGTATKVLYSFNDADTVAVAGSLDFVHAGDSWTMTQDTIGAAVSWSDPDGSGTAIAIWRNGGASVTFKTINAVYVTPCIAWDGGRWVIGGASSSTQPTLWDVDLSGLSAVPRTPPTISDGTISAVKVMCRGNWVYLTACPATSDDVKYVRYDRTDSTWGSWTTVYTGTAHNAMFDTLRCTQEHRLPWLFVETTTNVMWSERLSVNTAPSTPVWGVASPMAADAASPLLLEWSMNDPDPLDYLTSARLKRVRNGSTTTYWTGSAWSSSNVTFSCSDPREIITGGSAGATDVYTITNRDSESAESAESAALTVAWMARADPTITSPANGGTGAGARPTVTWSVSSQTEYLASLMRYQTLAFLMFTQSNVADYSTTNPMWWTGVYGKWGVVSNALEVTSIANGWAFGGINLAPSMTNLSGSIQFDYTFDADAGSTFQAVVGYIDAIRMIRVAADRTGGTWVVVLDNGAAGTVTLGNIGSVNMTTGRLRVEYLHDVREVVIWHGSYGGIPLRVASFRVPLSITEITEQNRAATTWVFGIRDSVVGKVAIDNVVVSRIATSETSGWITSAAQAHKFATIAADGSTLQARVWTKSADGVMSLGAVSNFTASASPAGPPTVTVTPDTASGSITVEVTNPPANMLIGEDGSFEGTVGTWVAESGCTVARSTAQAAHGSASLAMTATGSGTMGARNATGVSGVAVNAGADYTAMASFRAATTGRTCQVRVRWYTAAGAYLSESWTGEVTDTSSGWTTHTSAVTAPATAAFASVAAVVSNVASGEVHYVDKVGLFAGAATTWLPVDATQPEENEVWARIAEGGPAVGERSAGGVGVRIAVGVPVNGSIIDRLAPAAVPVEYRVVAIAAGEAVAASEWTG